MPLTPGQKLGPYDILAPLGKGGMGEVYKARDTRLNRIVAIKVAQDRFPARFEREARAVAALNHPNICQLYDVGPNYLVMEFVDGSRIAPPASPRELLDLAVQIADGLSAAHAANLIHRDLKPDNILLTRDGRVKILDFGLAKSAALSDDDLTRSIALTESGSTVGTIAYMSPEQARGEADLTPRSDQFSFGLVLYELSAGKRAFQRASPVETMTAIIREDMEPLPASIPAPLRWVITRLLSKEPAERYDSTRDLFRELRMIRERLSEISNTTDRPGIASAPKQRHLLRMILIGTACVAAGLAIATLSLPPSAPDLSAYRFTPLSRQEATEGDPRWSPDGKSIAFTTNVHGIEQVFTKAIDSPDDAQITHSTSNCRRPLWSPDGATIYYFSRNAMWAVPESGGAAEVVLENTVGATLHPDGKTVLFVRDGKLWVALLKSEHAQAFGEVGFADGFPEFSPDGSKVIASIGGDFWILPFPSGSRRKISGSPLITVTWFPDSRHVVATQYSSTYTLSVVDTLDASRHLIYTSPEPLVAGSVSPDGKRIAYTVGQSEWNVVEVSVPSGAVRTTVTGRGVVSWWPDCAPSGTHYLVSTNRSGTFAVEDISAAEGFSRRLTTVESNELGFGGARWAPDGSRFVFSDLLREGGSRFMISNSTGGRATVLDAAVGPVALSSSWSPDGRWIVYARRQGVMAELVTTRPGAGVVPVTLTELAIADWVNFPCPQWSPAGDWIAYPVPDGIALIASDGKVTRKLTTRKLQVFSFSKDGQQLFGILHNSTGEGAEWHLYSVDVRTGVDKLLGTVDLPASTNGLAGFSLHPDGKRFLTSIGKLSLDIWMLEGFDRPKGRLIGGHPIQESDTRRPRTSSSKF